MLKKYDKYDDLAEPDATPTLLFLILNELGEMNRLKRLELQKLCNITGEVPNMKDLKDQAV